MLFADILGFDHVKQRLITSVKEEKVSHAQMFNGAAGSANMPLALAFAQYLLCRNPTDEDSCGRCPSCVKTRQYQHPDLHFSFPYINSPDKKSRKSDAWLVEWRSYLRGSSYLDPDGWLEHIQAGNKPCIIPVSESESILQKLSLKSYEGGYKVMIMWLPERMNPDAANKLLKIIEEPPAKTVFLLVTHNTEVILPTILSRTQILRLARNTDEQVQQWLEKQHPELEDSLMQSIIQLTEGNLAEANRMAEKGSGEDPFLPNFVQWMRYCYGGNVAELTKWSDAMHKEGREQQKQFISYALHVVRQCIIGNYTSGQLARLSDGERAFTEKFAPFIHHNNVMDIAAQLNEAHSDIGRNCYAKIVLLDLSFNVAKLLKVAV